MRKFKVGDRIVWIDELDKDCTAIINEVTESEYIYDIYRYNEIRVKNYNCPHEFVEEDCRLMTKLDKALK